MSRCKQSSYWEFYPFSLKRRNNRDVHLKKYGKDLKRTFELSGFWQRRSLIKIELLVEFGDGIKILLRVSQHRTNRAFSSQSRCYDDERDEEDHDDHDGDNNCLWWCKQAPSEVTTGKMTARCIKITADNSQPSSNDHEFLQCHQDLTIALSLSVLSNIALFSLTISLILFPGLLSLFGCFGSVDKITRQSSSNHSPHFWSIFWRNSHLH